MTKTISRLALIGVVGMASVSSAFAQGQSVLHGKWVRDAATPAGLHGASPDGEDVVVEPIDVKVTRPGKALGKVLVPDGVERVDAINPRKHCRTSWETQRLVTECRDTGGGPGGGAPPLVTREVRWVDATGAMVVETTWEAGGRPFTVTSKYRKAEQQ